MKFTQILLASSVAALAGASRLSARARQGQGRDEETGACGEMCTYYRECADAIKADSPDNAQVQACVETELTRILDEDDVAMIDGSAFADIGALECQLKAEFANQVDLGEYVLTGLTFDENVDVCAVLVTRPYPVVPTECEAKEDEKEAMILEARAKAVMKDEFALWLADPSQHYLDGTVTEDVQCPRKGRGQGQGKGGQNGQGGQNSQGGPRERGQLAQTQAIR